MSEFKSVITGKISELFDKKEDLRKAERLLEWSADHALSSGSLAEQINPYDGTPLSVAPLTWSHAGFIIATLKYLDKMRKLS
mgnify:CR=1 FL=1